mmetsp:Transcript_4247/g.10277  ORF Transcript_4247/g.10277 Transcript_4247/m.10277 type:complete len:201 (-) Transcript_4247:304-906(-)
MALAYASDVRASCVKLCGTRVCRRCSSAASAAASSSRLAAVWLLSSSSAPPPPPPPPSPSPSSALLSLSSSSSSPSPSPSPLDPRLLRPLLPPRMPPPWLPVVAPTRSSASRALFCSMMAPTENAPSRCISLSTCMPSTTPTALSSCDSATSWSICGEVTYTRTGGSSCCVRYSRNSAYNAVMRSTSGAASRVRRGKAQL